MITLPNLPEWKGDNGQKENQCISLGYEGASEGMLHLLTVN